MYLQSSLSKNKTMIRRKIDIPDNRGRPRVYAEAKEMPFSKLAETDLLDTADIGVLYGVSPRTVYRWMAERGLNAHVKVGREYLFRKNAILHWDENFRPAMGRPLGS